MLNIPNDEYVVCSINTYNEISNSQMLSNVFSWGIGLINQNDFKLTLTDKNLYIESSGFHPLGTTSRNSTVDKISLSDISRCNVINQGGEEYITFTLKDNKVLSFIKNNETNDNMGTYLSYSLNNSLF